MQIVSISCSGWFRINVFEAEIKRLQALMKETVDTNIVTDTFPADSEDNWVASEN